MGLEGFFPGSFLGTGVMVAFRLGCSTHQSPYQNLELPILANPYRAGSEIVPALRMQIGWTVLFSSVT
jgi:hypothetical protein